MMIVAKHITKSFDTLNVLKGIDLEIGKGEIVSIVGPSGAGKTTLLKHIFQNYAYCNLESPDVLSRVQIDPGGFVRSGHNMIIDEIQRMPELLSYIQTTVDERGSMGDYIISGSENLLLSAKISQSLAGRAAYATLMPLTMGELEHSNKVKSDIYEQILFGFYPAVYSRQVKPYTYYDQYVATYVERDLKSISDVKNLSLFRSFLALLAGRIGQVVNYQSLSNDVGVSAKTIEHWISILEACYLVIRLRPYHNNYGKRYIKSPKIYFSDTGLACYLLGIRDKEALMRHHLIGGLFENYCVMDFQKRIFHGSSHASLYYFRDSNGNEVDLIIDTGLRQIPIEIKSGATFTKSFAKGIKYWNSKQTEEASRHGFVIYNGDDQFENKEFTLINQKNMAQIAF